MAFHARRAQAGKPRDFQPVVDVEPLVVVRDRAAGERAGVRENAVSQHCLRASEDEEHRVIRRGPDLGPIGIAVVESAGCVITHERQGRGNIDATAGNIGTCRERVGRGTVLEEHDRVGGLETNATSYARRLERATHHHRQTRVGADRTVQRDRGRTRDRRDVPPGCRANPDQVADMPAVKGCCRTRERGGAVRHTIGHVDLRTVLNRVIHAPRLRA